MNLWQQFEFGFPTGSNPAPPNLLKSTLANPVWNTGDKLVIKIYSKAGMYMVNRKVRARESNFGYGFGCFSLVHALFG